MGEEGQVRTLPGGGRGMDGQVRTLPRGGRGMDGQVRTLPGGDVAFVRTACTENQNRGITSQ